MKPLEILIKEEPIPKGRPRTSWKNGKVHTYNPDRTTFAQERITACLQQYKDKAFPPHVAIKLTCTFYRTKSKWLPKYERMPYRKQERALPAQTIHWEHYSISIQYEHSLQFRHYR